MAIIGLGTDIAEISRIEDSLKRLGERFAKRILCEPEFETYSACKQQHRFLAKRFSVKEAAAKALGTGIAKGVTFHDFEIQHDEWGKPLLVLHGVAADIAERKGVKFRHVSISDERHYTVATVILES
ncbi:holo-ACP synthase [Vibrio sp.]|uniref:Holo-[acyl-carrier-protein] synthase n=1 Tax=Vibrio viridaestus TaxID=2487322 RepID=A0A3N9THV5_9VIBR|nr:holo-ACP synthase [Vibrio viridaestus]MDC0610652.1 holo-ACP synthase [Vibrio sp.]RQW63779.1 holo-ACP synthase [Vibrio viridaestus]